MPPALFLGALKCEFIKKNPNADSDQSRLFELLLLIRARTKFHISEIKRSAQTMSKQAEEKKLNL